MTQQQELNNVIPWPSSQYVESIERWRNFMIHDRTDPTRLVVNEAIEQSISEDATVFVELGFGQAYDFQTFFRQLHDSGRIIYKGYDIVDEYVEFARRDYPDYEFEVSGFTDLERLSCDIIFTRHTLQHINEGLYPVCLTRFLRATRDLAVISWAMAPRGNGQYRFDHEAKIHWNTHSKQITDAVIKREGFVCTISSISTEKVLRKMYMLQRRGT